MINLGFAVAKYLKIRMALFGRIADMRRNINLNYIDSICSSMRMYVEWR